MWFSKRNNQRKEVAELQKQIEALQNLLESKKQPIEYHFHINQVDIHDPKLEEMSFNLDQLDIEDLSGALNVGNNFGVSVGDQKNKSKSDKSQINSKLTKNGYSISFNDKEG
ncbi:hypothetical protein [Alkalihalobacillus sp. AL-G]|uniref:hypothetical protein n=1 Tax=Alkalihalobacillus sp. AL-G TaxID=2926399 RepID=UPI00272D4E11|nr:hypothetical protein [Alkalihalobacillus sp. AL-G]WLD93296.1 spore germination protein GerPC [Alkalihalobacillus sp. AL-G]